jgi:hypothetical protein
MLLASCSRVALVTRDEDTTPTALDLAVDDDAAWILRLFRPYVGRYAC